MSSSVILKVRIHKKSVTNHHYDNMEPDAMLADHCAISATIANSPHPLPMPLNGCVKARSNDYVTLQHTKKPKSICRKVTNLKVPGSRDGRG